MRGLGDGFSLQHTGSGTRTGTEIHSHSVKGVLTALCDNAELPGQDAALIELITAICWREQMTGSVEHQAMTASQIA